MPDDIIQLMGDSVHLLKMKRLLLQEAAQAEAQAAEAARFRRREEVSHAYSSPAPAPHLSPTGQPPSAPQPPPASSPRVAVSSSVVVAPNREIFHWGKLYPETAAVHQIVNESMDKARGRSGQELNLLSVQTFSTEAAMKQVPRASSLTWTIWPTSTLLAPRCAASERPTAVCTNQACRQVPTSVVGGGEPSLEHLFTS